MIWIFLTLKVAGDGHFIYIIIWVFPCEILYNPLFYGSWMNIFQMIQLLWKNQMSQNGIFMLFIPKICCLMESSEKRVPKEDRG